MEKGTHETRASDAINRIIRRAQVRSASTFNQATFDSMDYEYNNQIIDEYTEAQARRDEVKKAITGRTHEAGR